MTYPKTLMLATAIVLSGTFVAAQPAKGPKEPVILEITVSPSSIAPGDEATVTVQITPKEGVKINRYPKIKLQIPGAEGLVAEAKAEIGSAKPPPPDQMDKNYYKVVDPIEVTISLDQAATAGSHNLEGKLTYFYCVTASGFCAPARVPIQIPIAVR